MEYALGGNPIAGGDAAGQLPMVAIVEEGGEEYLEMTFRRRSDAALRGLTYTPQQSPDLSPGSWIASGITVESIVPIDTSFDAVTVRLTTPLSAGVGTGFLRLMVEIAE